MEFTPENLAELRDFANRSMVDVRKLAREYGLTITKIPKNVLVMKIFMLKHHELKNELTSDQLKWYNSKTVAPKSEKPKPKSDGRKMLSEGELGDNGEEPEPPKTQKDYIKEAMAKKTPEERKEIFEKSKKTKEEVAQIFTSWAKTADPADVNRDMDTKDTMTKSIKKYTADPDKLDWVGIDDGKGKSQYHEYLGADELRDALQKYGDKIPNIDDLMASRDFPRVISAIGKVKTQPKGKAKKPEPEPMDIDQRIAPAHKKYLAGARKEAKFSYNQAKAHYDAKDITKKFVDIMTPQMKQQLGHVDYQNLGAKLDKLGKDKIEQLPKKHQQLIKRFMKAYNIALQTYQNPTPRPDNYDVPQDVKDLFTKATEMANKAEHHNP